MDIEVVVVVQSREGNAAPHHGILLLVVFFGLVEGCDGQRRPQQEVRHGVGFFFAP